MTDFTTEECWHTVQDDGEKLYCKTWKPTSTPKARVVFLHGFSDHCNLFGPFFPYLATHGIEVFALDQRGWGRSVKSARQKGLTGPTPRVLADIASILDRFIPSATTPPPSSSSTTTGPPLFLMGHSMGGGETIAFAASEKYKHQQSFIRGYLLASPWIRLHGDTAPWPVTVMAGRVAARVLPRFQLHNPVDASFLTRDQDLINRFKSDELVHDTGTLEGFAGCFERGADIDEGRIVLEEGQAKAMWAGHGTDDKICDYRGTEKWMNENCRVKDKTLRLYEGWLHRTNDQEGEKKEIFNREVTEWILERS